MLLTKQCLSFYQISEIIPLCLEGWANKILVWRGSYWAKQCDHSGALYKIRPYNYPSGGESLFLDALASLDLKLSVTEWVSNSPFFFKFSVIPVIPVIPVISVIPVIPVRAG